MDFQVNKQLGYVASESKQHVAKNLHVFGIIDPDSKEGKDRAKLLLQDYRWVF